MIAKQGGFTMCHQPLHDHAAVIEDALAATSHCMDEDNHHGQPKTRLS
jgi:hypothetical protein